MVFSPFAPLSELLQNDCIECVGLRWSYKRKEMYYRARYRGGLEYYIFRVRKPGGRYVFSAERRWQPRRSTYKKVGQYLGMYVSMDTAKRVCEMDMIGISEDEYADYI